MSTVDTTVNAAVKPEGVEEGLVRKDVDVVLQAHEGGLAHGGETLEGKIDAPDEGPDEADDERQQGGQYEHRPIFTDGLLHDIPPEKEGEAGEHIARLPVIQLLRKIGERLAVGQLVLLGPAVHKGGDHIVPAAGAVLHKRSVQSRRRSSTPRKAWWTKHQVNAGLAVGNVIVGDAR